MVLASLKMINLVLRFMLELSALTIYGYWGYKTGGSPIIKVGLAFIIPAAVAISWGLFGAPKADLLLSGFTHLSFEMLIFLLPSILLLNQGKTKYALIYGIIVILNRILLFIWRQ